TLIVHVTALPFRTCAGWRGTRPPPAPRPDYGGRCRQLQPARRRAKATPPTPQPRNRLRVRSSSVGHIMPPLAATRVGSGAARYGPALPPSQSLASAVRHEKELGNADRRFDDNARSARTEAERRGIHQGETRGAGIPVFTAGGPQTGDPRQRRAHLGNAGLVFQ